MKTKHTYCRICEPFCPIMATIDDEGKAVKLSTSPNHPKGGTACHKGLSFLEVHNDPARLNGPLKRRNPRTQKRGDFEPIEWEQALSEIGEKLRAIREEYGPNAIAFYAGNPLGGDYRGFAAHFSIAGQSGSSMLFGAGTQDVSNKFRVVCDIYGSLSLMIPDLENTDYFLCLGANPKVSRWTIFSHPNDSTRSLKAIKERGGEVCFVNPRRTESSTEETGRTLRIKPGADAYFLAAVLHEIHKKGGVDTELVAKYGKNVEAMLDFVARYSADKVADVTGLPAEEIRNVAAGIMAAKSAAVYTSTGVNQSRQGVLCVWLAEMINFVTGNVGKKGGSYSATDLEVSKQPAEHLPMVETSMGSFVSPAGPVGFPAALMADFIENGEIKALITSTGNPLLSIGGEEKMRSAFEKLELMVNIDIMRSSSVEMADYALPGTSWLEREDVNLNLMGMQANPAYLEYTDAVEQPVAERRDMWWILCRIAQELSIPSMLDDPASANDGFAMANMQLAQIGMSVDALKSEPMGVKLLESKPYDSFFERCLQHPDKKIDCLPQVLIDAGLFERCDRFFAEYAAESDDQLKLISLRTTHMHNSWYTNTSKFRKGAQLENPLHMCSEDAKKRGLFDGDAVRICNENGDIQAVLRINDDLRPGSVAMSHGYGHHDAFDLPIASDKPGVNCNRLMPTSPDSVEPLSHMSWLTGVPVNVSRL